MSIIWVAIIFAVTFISSMYLILECQISKMLKGICFGVNAFMTIAIMVISYCMGNQERVLQENSRVLHDYICSTRNGSYIYGRFSMYGGRIDEFEMYIYYSQSSTGGYERNMVKADDSIIFESDETPHVDLVVTSYKVSWWIFYTESEPKTNYYFYVPKGTIIQEYILN